MLVKSVRGFPDTPFARIPLQNGFAVLVDPEWFDRFIWQSWYAKKSFHCWYACLNVYENGRHFIYRMHRIVANTPFDQVCHHINKNTFDNRSSNLLNMSWYDHTKQHSYR